MKFYKLTEAQLRDKPTCCYEVWDSNKKKMVKCGQPAVWSLGARCSNPLCEEHGRFAGAVSQNFDDYKTIKKEIFRR